MPVRHVELCGQIRQAVYPAIEAFQAANRNGQFPLTASLVLQLKVCFEQPADADTTTFKPLDTLKLDALRQNIKSVIDNITEAQTGRWSTKNAANVLKDTLNQILQTCFSGERLASAYDEDYAQRGEENIAGVRAERDDLRGRVAALTQELADANTQQTHISLLKTSADERFTQEQEESARLRERITRLETQDAEQRAELAKLRTLDDVYQALKTEHTEVKDQLDAANPQKVAWLEEQNDKLQQEVNTLKGQVDPAAMARLTTTNEMLEARIAQLQADLNSEKQEHRAYVRELPTMIGEQIGRAVEQSMMTLRGNVLDTASFGEMNGHRAPASPASPAPRNSSKHAAAKSYFESNGILSQQRIEVLDAITSLLLTEGGLLERTPTSGGATVRDYEYTEANNNLVNEARAMITSLLTNAINGADESTATLVSVDNIRDVALQGAIRSALGRVSDDARPETALAKVKTGILTFVKQGYWLPKDTDYVTQMKAVQQPQPQPQM